VADIGFTNAETLATNSKFKI